MTAAAPAPTRYANDSVTFLPLDCLQPSKTNPRRMVDKKADAELVESIKTHGIAQPLLVRVIDEMLHEVVAGARRLRCAKLAGLLEVPCFVRQMTDAQALELQLIENTHRRDVHPLDEGVAFREMIEKHGYTAEALAEKVGRSERWVYGRMALAKLPAEVQTLYVEGQIDLSIAQLLTTVPEEFQEKAAQAILKGDYTSQHKPMSFRQAKEFVAGEYHCTLANAPFPTGQKDLVPDMGACTTCPHATNNQAGLFDQVLPDKDAKKAPALCTLPSCYAKKTRAAFEVRALKVEEAGGKVLRGKEAESASGTDVDAVCHQDPKQRTWRQLLGKHLPVVTLVEPIEKRGRHQAARELVAPAKLRTALKAAGHGRLAPKAAKSSVGASMQSLEDQAARCRREDELRKKRRDQVERAFASVLPAFRNAAADLHAAHGWALVILHGLGDSLPAAENHALKEYLGFDLWEQPERLLEEDPAKLQAVAIEYAMRDGGWSFDGKWTEQGQAIARACGINLKAALAGIVAADKAASKEVARASRAAAKAAKAEAKGGKTKKAKARG